MRKIKPQSFVIKLDPYPFDLFVGINIDNDRFIKEVKELGVDLDSSIHINDCDGRTFRFLNGAYGLVVKDFTGEVSCIGILAHEAFHVVEFLFDKIGIKHSVKYSSEAYAYLLQKIIVEILGSLK